MPQRVHFGLGTDREPPPQSCDGDSRLPGPVVTMTSTMIKSALARCLGYVPMSFLSPSRTKWIIVGACILSACSSSSGHSSGTTTTTGSGSAAVGTIAPSAWKQVAQGRFQSKPWAIATALSTNGWRCYDAQGAARPQSDTTSTTAPVPTRQGRPARCLPPAGTSSAAPFVAFINGTEGSNWVVVGGVADGVKHVSIVFGDGTSTPLNIDPHSRLVIWKGPASVRPSKIRADATTCAIDQAHAANGETLCAT